MEIKNIGYNIGEVTISTSITIGTKTEIGDAVDFGKIALIATAGGLCRVHCTADNNQLDGLILMTYGKNDNYEGIDFGSVTNFGGSPYVIAGTFTLEDGKAYVTMSMNAITASNRSTKSSK